MRVLLPEGLPWPPTGPGLWKTDRLVHVTEGAARKHSPVRESRCHCHPGAQGPVAESREWTAWLPALLVWTWVRAHRQLHAGNAGLRPATTNFPIALLVSPWVVRDAAL